MSGTLRCSVSESQQLTCVEHSELDVVLSTFCVATQSVAIAILFVNGHLMLFLVDERKGRRKGKGGKRKGKKRRERKGKREERRGKERERKRK